MSEHADLAPAGTALLTTLAGVEDEHLDRLTPCEARTVSQLLQHLVAMTAAFRATAEKDFGPLTDTTPNPDVWPAAEPGWRAALEEQIPQMVRAWRDDAAWEQTTRAGGVEMPGEVAGLVALDELVLHGWDLARATGQEYALDEETAAASLEFLKTFDEHGTPGLFGPSVSVADDAVILDRLVALSGRDPQWSPS